MKKVIRFILRELVSIGLDAIRERAARELREAEERAAERRAEARRATEAADAASVQRFLDRPSFAAEQLGRGLEP